MNSDQIKGKVKQVAGNVQRKAGEAVDSPKQRMKGTLKVVEGKAQKSVGDTKEATKDAMQDSHKRG